MDDPRPSPLPNDYDDAYNDYNVVYNDYDDAYNDHDNVYNDYNDLRWIRYHHKGLFFIKKKCFEITKNVDPKYKI